MLKLLGVDLMNDSSSFLKTLYSVILLLTAYSITVLEIIELFNQWSDIDTIISVLTFVVGHTLGNTQMRRFVLYLTSAFVQDRPKSR